MKYVTAQDRYTGTKIIQAFGTQAGAEHAANQAKLDNNLLYVDILNTKPLCLIAKKVQYK